MTPKPQPKKPKNPKHRTMSFRKARLMREAERRAIDESAQQTAKDLNMRGLYNCGCIDFGDDAFVGCESCGYKSCLDCHHIDSTPANVDDWKCKEGHGCNTPRGEEE